ncbi:MAG TPA: class I SAM-dependent methyltransferase [Chitinophagaceae bacterium]|nr:class I SAM-dependent methyltransferase [Chitinophagaceae bacterium]
MAMYDNENTVQKSFDLDYVSEYLVQAQWAEFVELKKAIAGMADRKNAAVSILDIGIGNARIPKHLCGIREIWDKISLYDGTDNAAACIEISKKEIEKLNIRDKVSAYLFEATNLHTWNKNYDLVITTWFTAGNFYPDDFPFETYKDAGKRLDLATNPKFTGIFRNAYDLLNPGGEIVIGACYKDNDATRLKQEESYRKMGMTMITDEKDSFTATKEQFWSQRFTKEKLFNYLSFVHPSQISFTPLDTYNYAMQVRIRK